MGNLTRKTQHSQYAPKWARHIDNEPGIAKGEDRQALAGHLLRRLEPEIVEYPELPTGRLERRFPIGGLVVASVIGAAIVVAVTDAPRWTSEFGVGTNAVVRPGDNSAQSATQRAPQGAPAAVAGGAKMQTRTAALKPMPAIQGATDSAPTATPKAAMEPTPAVQGVTATATPKAAMEPTPAGQGVATTATRTVAAEPTPAIQGVATTAIHKAALEPTPAVQGVTNGEIRMGISAPFSGPAKELGNQMKLGIETAFAQANDAGGVNHRQVKLIAADDGYEPKQTAETMAQLYEKDNVLGFIGNVGTPTAAVALPYALKHHALFFGAFTGAGLLRRDPPDRYVFNYRASYAEETSAVVRYLVRVRHLRPGQIAVFAQHDAFGDAGFDGVARAIRALNGDDATILRFGYERNTTDIDNAVAGVRTHKRTIKAIVMVATYRPAALFIEKTHDIVPGMIYTNVSFVDSTALASELMLQGPRFANGVIVTQVVPAIDSYASAVLKYKHALAKYQGGEEPDFVSFEGYVDGGLLLEGLRRAGPQPDTEKLVDGLESISNLDMGLGAPITFGPSEHQGSHKVWGTELNAQGHYEPIELQ